MYYCFVQHSFFIVFIYSNRLNIAVADLVEIGLKLNMATAISKINKKQGHFHSVYCSTAGVIIISRH